MPFPFEVTFDEIRADPDAYVDAVFDCLESEFMVMPRGHGFVEFPTFEFGYETLKKATRGFQEVNPENVTSAVFNAPVALLVLRCMLGFTPPEWAEYATRHTGVRITQGAARSLDRTIRMNPDRGLAGRGTVTKERIDALITAACHLLRSGVPSVPRDSLHRSDKADTREGLTSLRSIADLGAPYSVLLYERLLGRPFAAHRDSVSELVGNLVESAIEDVMTRAGISYRKTLRAERVTGFDQAPDSSSPTSSTRRSSSRPSSLRMTARRVIRSHAFSTSPRSASEIEPRISRRSKWSPALPDVASECVGKTCVSCYSQQEVKSSPCKT